MNVVELVIARINALLVARGHAPLGPNEMRPPVFLPRQPRRK
jgi:hypothetical protein